MVALFEFSTILWRLFISTDTATATDKFLDSFRRKASERKQAKAVQAKQTSKSWHPSRKGDQMFSRPHGRQTTSPTQKRRCPIGRKNPSRNHEFWPNQRILPSRNWRKVEGKREWTGRIYSRSTVSYTYRYIRIFALCSVWKKYKNRRAVDFIHSPVNKSVFSALTHNLSDCLCDISISFLQLVPKN